MMPSVPEDTPREGVGVRLKRLRVERGFSQRDLSSPGVSYAYISRIEAGARTPSVKALRKLSQKLGVSVEYLETWRDILDVDDRELRLTDVELELGSKMTRPGRSKSSKGFSPSPWQPVTGRPPRVQQSASASLR